MCHVCRGKKTRREIRSVRELRKVIVFKRVVRVYLTENRHLSKDLNNELAIGISGGRAFQ